MIKQSWKFAKEYFGNSEKRWSARGLLALIVSLELFVVYLNVQFNQWNNDFYNSLQEMNQTAFEYNIKKFLVMAIIFVFVAGYKTFFNQLLQTNWRNWMTEKYLGRWLSHKTFYGLTLDHTERSENVDQRIAEDIFNYVKYTSLLTIDLLATITTFVSFISILWAMSTTVSFVLFGIAISIPKFMVLAALTYAVFGTYVAHKIGKPLAKLRYDQEKREADFRYSLVRIKDNSESIALFNGEEFENKSLMGKLSFIIKNYKTIIKRQKFLSWFVTYHSQFAVVFPYMLNAPRFFAGTITLGGLMQVSSAFDKIQTALSWVLESYTSLAIYKAVVTRLSGIEGAISEWEEKFSDKNLIRKKSSINKIDNLTVFLPSGEKIIDNQSLTLFDEPKKYIITGKSGTGKSTLLRSVATLWPYAEGTIYGFSEKTSMFISQESYMPQGSLVECLAYPKKDISDSDLKNIKKYLKLFGMIEFESLLDDENDWSKILSGGQKQKVAIIRALINRPKILFLDESTSNMDEESEEISYKMISKVLSKTTVISVGHRSSLKKHHDYDISLKNKKIIMTKIDE